MQEYSQILQELSSYRLAEDCALDLPDELTLQAIWFNGQFGRDFISTDGRNVVVKQFGFWNRSAGPDFLHASVEIDGVISSGPLELDTHASDWESHGHDTNPSFNEVILHVIFADAQQQHFTRTENHSEVVKVVVPSEIVSAALHQPRLATTTANIGRCHTPLNQSTATVIDQLMRGAAKLRCSQKAKRLRQIQSAHGKDQALWIALAETLGYKPNKQCMAQVAQRLPINYLRKHTELIQPLAFGLSGFLHPAIHEQAADDSQQWLEQLWTDWWKHRDQHQLSDERSIQWCLSGIRPINHPQRRLATLSLVAQHWPTFRKLARSTSDLITWLESLEDPFWSYHYTLTSKRSSKRLSLIGKDRIRDLLVNHLLPLRIADGEEAAWEDYKKLPAPAISEPVNRASTRLFGQREDKKLFLKKAWQHQALLQIYHDFCLEDVSDCESCPFPEQLRQL